MSRMETGTASALCSIVTTRQSQSEPRVHHRVVVRGSVVAVLAQAVHLVLRLFLTPFVVREAGFEAYGFWSILFVALGLMGVHRMGLLSASVSFVARHIAARQIERARAVLRTTGTLALLLAIVVGGPIVWGADLVVQVLGTPMDLVPEASLTLRVTVVATAVALVLGGYQSALEAHQKFVRVLVTNALAQVLEAILILFLLSAGYGLIGLALAYAVRIVLPIPVHMLGLRATDSRLSGLPGRIDLRELREVLRLGGSIQLMGAVHMGIAAVPRLALAHLVGLGSAGLYEVGRKLAELAAALPAHALGPVIPAAAAIGSNDLAARERLRGLMRGANRAVAFLGALPLVVLVLIAPDVVLAWLGEPQEEVAMVIRILAPAAWFHLCTGPSTAVLRGLARPRLELLYSAVWLLLLALLVPVSTMLGGLLAGALAVALGQAIACALLLYLALPELHLSRGATLHDFFVAAGCAVAAAGASLLVVTYLPEGSTRGIALAKTLTTASLTVVLGVPLFFTFALDRAERDWTLTFIRRRLRTRRLKTETAR